MENSTLAPTGDMSVDPRRDQPQKDGGGRYLDWNLGAAGQGLDLGQHGLLTCLGAAVVTRWAELPRNVQKALFETAAMSTSSGTTTPELCQAIARFLHDQGEHNG